VRRRASVILLYRVRSSVRRFKELRGKSLTDVTGPCVCADCIVVTSEEGQFFHKSTADDASTVCGVYILTDPDRRVEVHFDYLDVPCENRGLVSVG
jgi:hypothetical protein